MNPVLLYGSSHGRTRKVIAEALPRLGVQPPVHDVKEIADPSVLAAHDVWIVFCPTYGDEELQPDMEVFLQRLTMKLTGKRFALAELGNYYGYDDFSFGAMAILRRRFLELGATELCTPLSLDSLPKVNWGQLHRWVDHLNAALKSHV